MLIADMSNLVELVDSLQFKVNRLIERDCQSTKKVMELEAELTEKTEAIRTLQVKVEELTARNQTLKTANAMLGSNDYKKETKLKINGLIREIDQCIVQLSE